MFNNAGTVREVVAGCREILGNVVVLDDGSTDADLGELLSGLDVTILRHGANMGKGQAILTSLRHVDEKGGEYLIVIDADGQHDPGDIKKFIPPMLDGGPSLIVGCRDFDTENVPGKSRFGRKFANFWLRVETGLVVDDCQSGFRAYPVRYINRINFRGARYDFEAEVLAKAAWAGIPIKTVPISVYYPKAGERVSGFRPFMDNLRISLVHAYLVGRRLLPFGHERLVEKKAEDSKTIRHPIKFLNSLLREHSTPGGLAAAAAVGIFFGALPLLFLHTLVILYVSARLSLNRLVAVNAQHLCMPPFVPALCIEVGHYMRNGRWLTDISFETVFRQFSDRLIEWLLGSLIIAPLGALAVGLAVFSIASVIRKRGLKNG